MSFKHYLIFDTATHWVIKNTQSSVSEIWGKRFFKDLSEVCKYLNNERNNMKVVCTNCHYEVEKDEYASLAIDCPQCGGRRVEATKERN